MTNTPDTMLGPRGEDGGAHSGAGTQPSSATASALSFFSHKVDGEWRGGWFRMQAGHLELYAAGQVRTTVLADSQDPVPLLRELLTDMVRARH